MDIKFYMNAGVLHEYAMCNIYEIGGCAIWTFVNPSVFINVFFCITSRRFQVPASIMTWVLPFIRWIFYQLPT